jgi:hypothetical protein
MNKFVFIPVIILLVLSSAANVYFLKTEQPKIDTNTLQTQAKYIKSLELELNTAKETLSSVTKNTSTTLTSTSLKDVTEIEQIAINFIKHAYNVTPENYASMKSSAREIMSKKLAETLFGAPGIDENQIDFVTKAVDIEVFQHTKDKQAIVRFKVYSKQNSSNFEKEEQQLMCLYFKRLNGQLIVDAIEPISDLGEV